MPGVKSLSVHWRVKTYLHSTMSQCSMSLNHIILLHCHKDLTDSLKLVAVANEVVDLSSYSIFWMIYKWKITYQLNFVDSITDLWNIHHIPSHFNAVETTILCNVFVSLDSNYVQNSYLWLDLRKSCIMTHFWKPRFFDQWVPCT